MTILRRPQQRLLRRSLLLAFAATCAFGCVDETDSVESDPTSSELGFPVSDEEAAQGKTDTFGRSLVGVPSPYVPNADYVADPVGAEELLRADMKARREMAWATAFKVLEPVPLLGLQNQLEARPDCPDGVETRDVDKCGRQSSESACTGFESNGVGGICSWDGATESCSPTCDHLTLAGAEIPQIPRWETWYGLEDISKIFGYAYEQLSEEEKRQRTPFTDAQIGAAMQAAHSEIERSSRWPLWRYARELGELSECTLERGIDETDEGYGIRCAEARQSQFSGAAAPGGGIARMMYSPAMVLHMMRNYGEVLACADEPASQSWCEAGQDCTDPTDNFSTCFRAEFPADAGNPWAGMDPAEVGDVAGLPTPGGTVLIKATWSRVGFGVTLPAFDTDADAIERILGPGQLADWGEDGDRQYEVEGQPDTTQFPTPDDIYTIRTNSGAIYRLTGLHIMTKELRHWTWITLWWSDDPDGDFGEDRPASFDDLPGVWSNYKMCVVVDYQEFDPDVMDSLSEFPSLASALEATGSVDQGSPTWCSNPYIEHEAGNARTNCIGCHQHAGSRFDEAGSPGFPLEEVIAEESAESGPTNPFPANGRLRRRHQFPSDYSWAFSRLDDLTELIRSEVEVHGTRDERWVRINSLLNGEGDPVAGETVFREASADETCTDCHGDSGEGGFGPAYLQVFAQKTDWQIMATIVEGRGSMPAWGERLTDQQLIDLFAFLETTFDVDE